MHFFSKKKIEIFLQKSKGYEQRDNDFFKNAMKIDDLCWMFLPSSIALRIGWKWRLEENLLRNRGC